MPVPSADCCSAERRDGAERTATYGYVRRCHGSLEACCLIVRAGAPSRSMLPLPVTALVHRSCNAIFRQINCQPKTRQNRRKSTPPPGAPRGRPPDLPPISSVPLSTSTKVAPRKRFRLRPPLELAQLLIPAFGHFIPAASLKPGTLANASFRLLVRSC